MSTSHYDQLSFFATLAAQINVVTQVQVDAVVPAGRLPAELQPARVATLPSALRALFYLKQKAARDAEVAALDIALAPVHSKDDAKIKARSLERRAQWLKATFHEAVMEQYPVLNGKDGFGIGPQWSVLDLELIGQHEDLQGLSDLLNSLFASGQRQHQPH